VQLSTGSLVHVDPNSVLFGTASARIYMREPGGQDVFVLELEPRDQPGDANRFTTNVLQLAAGGPVSDMVVYSEAGAERLLTVQRDTDEVRILDPTGQRHFDLPLDHPASRVILHRGFAGHPIAVLYEEDSRWVTFLDLVAAETGGVSRHSVRLAEPVSDTLGVLDGGLVIFRHGQSVLSIIDVEDAAIRLLSVNGDLDDATYDDTLGNLWIAPRGQHFIGVIDLLTGRTDEILLDAPVHKLVPVPDADRVVVIHPDDRGSVTLLDAHRPKRSTALEITQFL
jgi:hypothetical protein